LFPVFFFAPCLNFGREGRQRKKKKRLCFGGCPAAVFFFSLSEMQASMLSFLVGARGAEAADRAVLTPSGANVRTSTDDSSQADSPQLSPAAESPSSSLGDTSQPEDQTGRVGAKRGRDRQKTHTRTYSRRVRESGAVPSSDPRCLTADICDYDSILGKLDSGPRGIAAHLDAVRAPRRRKDAIADSKHAKSHKKRRTSSEDGASAVVAGEQMFLDLGQRNFSAVECSECGMVYNPGVPEDEADHNKTHAARVLGVRPLSMPPGWEPFVVDSFADGKVLSFNQAKLDNVPVAIRRKVSQIRETVDRELNYACPRHGAPGPDEKTFLFLNSSGKIAGCAVVERIHVAFPSQTSTALRQTRIAELFRKESIEAGAESPPSGAEDGQPAAGEPLEIVACDTSRPAAARCGVSRIWVFHKSRRRGIATKLLDSIRVHFFYGDVVPKDELAFTQPTREGSAVFAHYTSRTNFLLFNPKV
jgi:ESCO1/2 acetyl-transferase/zinc-finger of acetyl-transferase ESCO